MRIAHVASAFKAPLGGAEHYALRIATAQREAGHDVAIVTAWIDPATASHIRQYGLELIVVKRWRPYAAGDNGPGLWRKIAFHLADMVDLRRVVPRSAGEFDIVHLHRFQGLGAGALRRRGETLVHTVHDFALVDTAATSVRENGAVPRLGLAQRLRGRWMNLCARRIDAVIFPSERTSARHFDLGFRSSHASVIPHGWQLDGGGRAEPRLVAADSPVTFGFVGKVEAHKGAKLLADAWGAGIPGARLLVVGAGTATSSFESRTATLLGYVEGEQLASAYSNIDVMVVPSLWPENFPLVVAEGLIAGCAFVATATASPPLVFHGENALIVREDADDLREAMATIAFDRHLVSAMSSSSLAYAKDLDMQVHRGRIEDCYANAQRMAASRESGEQRP